MDSTLTGQEEVLISALSGQEEVFSDHDISSRGMHSLSDMPILFRTCDAKSSFDDLFARYDENTSQELEEEEEEKVCSKRSERTSRQHRRARHMLTLLEYVYDIDEDGIISDEERVPLYSDFSTRCEAIHAQLLSEFDTDGDGVLNEEEKEAVQNEALQRHEEGDRHAHDEDEKEDLDRERRAHGKHTGLPPFARAYDLDENGTLSNEEKSTFRSDMRISIQSGEAFGSQCGDRE
jgi:Ca2+-binding EF-hand superfamily protein